MSLATLLNIDATRNFLQDGDIYDALIDVGQKYQIPEERVGELLDLTDAVLDEQIPLAEVPGLLKEAFDLSDARSQELAVEVSALRLLPLEDFFPGIEEQLRIWGADVSLYEKGMRIEKEMIDAESFARRVVSQAGLTFSDLLLKRLAFLLEQRMSGQKTGESLKIFFGRPLTIGGLGLAKEQIDTLLQVIEEGLGSVRLVSEEEFRAKQKMKEQVVADAQEKESGALVKEQLPLEESSKNEEKVFTTALEIPPSHEMAAEVPVISSPIQEEQRQQGQKAERASIALPLQKDRVSEPALLEEKPEAIAKKRAEKAKKNQDEAIKVAFSEAIDIALEKSKAILDEGKIPTAAFADIVGKMLRGIRDQYQTRDILERDYKVKGEQLSLLMQALLQAQDAYRVAGDALKRVEDVRVEITDEDAQAWEEQEAKKTEEKFASLTKQSQKPAPAVVELTVGSVAPVQENGVPKKVTDIVSGNKLMGPVEQLGTMTLADFRRLSTNPDEAVRKMEALLLSLQKTSYEDRVRGVLAWRKSPLATLYVTLMGESLNTGVAVAEIAARRRSQGQESLGPAEMQALARWNEKTRF